MESKRIRVNSGITEKQCSTCERWLPLTSEYFHKSKQRKDGYKTYCKECRGGKFGYTSPNVYAEFKQEGFHICVKCGRSLPITDDYFHRTKATATGFIGTCKECMGHKFGKQKSVPIEAQKTNKAEYQRNYLKNNTNFENRYIWAINRRTIVKGLEGNFTNEQRQFMLEYFNNSCAYCGISEDVESDHFLSVKSGGATTADNILPVCSKCNHSKSNFDFLPWYLKQPFYSEERLLSIVRYINNVNTVVTSLNKNELAP